jgi:putative oxidoreductase
MFPPEEACMSDRSPLAAFSSPADQLAARAGDFILLIGRIAIAAIFIQSAYGKLSNPAAFASYLAGQGLPLSLPLTYIGIAFEILGALALIVGFQVRYGVLLLFAFTIIATLISHRYWEFAGPARETQEVHFLKNLAMIGGLLVLFVNGGGSFGFDRLIKRS